ncbi:response regulator [Paenibacillus xanthanilyticus]|uniref:Response regulator n=1 Tax=Paenibacillus xanthanilyticus TaxID=1783531 RepID=A0ABV8JVP0_9BACL
MHEVLIVDDEPVARQSLRYLIDWESYGFTVGAEAENGLRALELLKDRHFALVLTDIRMPTMDGLALIARIREFTDAYVVILSGYDDFEYARQGMKYGVKEYLLKPLDEDDLIEVLRRTAADIAENRLFKRRHRLGMSAIREQFIRKLAHGGLTRKEFDDQLALLEMEGEAERFCCLAVELDFVFGGFEAAGTVAPSERDIELKRYAVRNICEEVTAGFGFVFEEAEDRYGIVCAGDAADLTDPAVRELAGQLSRSVAAYVKETVTIGIGPIVDGFRQAAASFSAAEDALDRKFLTGCGTVLEGRDRQPGSESALRLYRGAEDGLLDAVRSGRTEEVRAQLDALWQRFRAADVPSNQAKQAALELFVQLYRIVRESGTSQAELFDQGHEDYESVMRSKTMDELLLVSARKCEDIVALLRRGRELRPNRIVEEVKRLVQEQFGGSVSLRSVAQQIYMNPKYLGKLFKSGTGMAFNDYVMQLRMEKAKELLLHSDMKVYEIAEAVGYGELDWFYKRFKAYAGISASEYRGR